MSCHRNETLEIVQGSWLDLFVNFQDLFGKHLKALPISVTRLSAWGWIRCVISKARTIEAKGG